jgi:hypothetical protein
MAEMTFRGDHVPLMDKDKDGIWVPDLLRSVDISRYNFNLEMEPIMIDIT